MLAYSKLQGRPITTELAAEALKDIIQVPKSKNYNPRYSKVVGHYYNVRIEDFGKKRTKSIAYPRQIAMYLSRELTDFSLPKIGEEFGGRDHTTVIHAHEKIAKDIKADTIFKQEVEDLEKKFAINKIKVENCYTTDYEMIKWEIKIVTSYYGIRSNN